MSLHHMADPAHALAEVYAALRPGGLVAVVETGTFPRFLPEDEGLEARCHALVDEAKAEALPHLGADWGVHLTKAGFTIETEREFTFALTPPLPAATGRYAQLSLQRLRSGVENRLTADELTALDTLIAGVPHRDDLTVRGSRTVWAAGRL